MQRSLAALFFCFMIGNSAIAQDRDSIRGTFIESTNGDLGKDFLLDSTKFFKESGSEKEFVLYLRSYIYVRMGREYIVEGIFTQKHIPVRWGMADCKRIAQLAWPDLNSTDLKRIAPQIERSLKEYPEKPLLLVSATSTAESSDNKIQEPIKVSGNIQESKLIKRSAPIYPELAKRNHVSGYVTLLIAIDEEGNVAGIKVLSGDPVLIDAAVAAVREWKYSPMLMDGYPVRAMGTVTVLFNLR